MAPRFDKQTRLAILGILLALTATYAAKSAIDTVRLSFHAASFSRDPLLWEGVPLRITTLRPEAEKAGLSKGDQLLAVNGKPLTGAGVYVQEYFHVPPGSHLLLTVKTAKTGEAKTADIVLQPRTANISPWLACAINIGISSFCFVLGFWVAFLRPMDGRAWILLGLMLTFAPLFTYGDGSTWPAWVRPLAYFYRTGCALTWPFWLIRLGFQFPERLPVPEWVHRAAWVFTIPILIYAAFGTFFQWAYIENLQLAAKIYGFAEMIAPPALILNGLAVCSYFVLIGRSWRLAKTPDAKRRAKLLNAGTYLSFMPLLVLLVVGLFTGQLSVQKPTPFVIFAVSMLAIFPLTLAYIVVVHRAMDVRMVLRTGLQYALARRGVAILQIAISLAALLYGLNAADDTMDQFRRLLVLATAVTFVALLFPIANRLRAWTDRRFFRDAYNSEQILTDLSEQVRTIVETQPLLETIATRISESLHVSQIAMLLRNGTHYAPAYALGYSEPVSAVFDLNAPVLERLLRDRSPQITYLDDPDCWVNQERPEDRLGIRALQSQLLLPLAPKNELIGFISLGPKRSEEPYTPADVRLLRSVAAQAGLAIDNSRLTATVATEMAQREQINREMAIAREVQQRLFPQRLPAVEGVEYAGACRPAQSVGGDYYDFVELPSGEFGFAVGDVSGKGMPAALLMAALQASLRGQAMNGVPDLALFLSNINKLIYDMSPKSHFATLFYGQYLPASRTLRYANGGHNPPLLLRADGTVKELAATGPGVGLSRRSVYRQAELQVEPGDLLIAFTDGFTEAMNLAREEFSEARLREAACHLAVLPAQQIIPQVMLRVDAFTAGAAQHDDMTMVVMKVL